MPQGLNFGALALQMGVKNGHVAYQIDGDDEQNIMQVKVQLLSKGQAGDLGVR